MRPSSVLLCVYLSAIGGGTAGECVHKHTHTHTHPFDVDVCTFSPFARFTRSDKTFVAHERAQVQAPLPPLFATAPLYMRSHFRVAAAATQVGPMIDFHNARVLCLIN